MDNHLPKFHTLSTHNVQMPLNAKPAVFGVPQPRGTEPLSNYITLIRFAKFASLIPEFSIQILGNKWAHYNHTNPMGVHSIANMMGWTHGMVTKGGSIQYQCHSHYPISAIPISRVVIECNPKWNVGHALRVNKCPLWL